MAVFGRIRRRLALAIVLTAFIPVLVSILFAEYVVRETSSRFYQPEVREQLDQSLDVYKDLARAIKARMRASARAIAADPELRRAVDSEDESALREALRASFDEYPDLVSLSVLDADGKVIAAHDRGRPIDESTEHALEVRRPLGAEDELDEVPQLVAVFATPSARFQQRDRLSETVDSYKRMERRRQGDDTDRVYAFIALLGITIVMAVGVGTLLARGVSTRIGRLAEATHEVGAGNLEVRVPEKGGDEIADLARAFNQMLGEVESSRARIEYLQRIGAWQEMARRLAHEIKNPLTPIQLAVQEVHRRYPGDDPKYTQLLDTTLEVVEDEVGTLRRLVGEFSSFARLPQAQLEEADLCEFLREQQRRLSLHDDEHDDLDRASTPGLVGLDVQVQLELPEGEAPVRIDRQMLRRALINLVRNAAQAMEQSSAAGQVRIRVRRARGYWCIDVDDSGPGIDESMRATVFDPYVTSKTEGTGLGLAIVKKIIVEHGGTISAMASPDLGGARIRLLLPVDRNSDAAKHESLRADDWSSPASVPAPRFAEPASEELAAEADERS